jgi:hypothetical protein
VGFIRYDSGSTFQIRDPVVLTDLRSSFVSENKLTLLGAAGRAQAVVVYDLESKKKLDWFFCYQPQQISSDLIAYVEFYPSHAAEEPTDVVLIYDLRKSPEQNRLTSRTDRGGHIQVGTPVYPQENARKRSYANAAANINEARHVLGPPFFLLLSSQRLVFLSAEGEDARNYRSSLIVIDLFKGPDNAPIVTLPIPADQFNATPENPSFLRATSLQEISPTEVRLSVPKSQYGVDSITVHIP